MAKAIELAPQDAVAHYYLAKTLTAQSKSAEALQELRKAAALKPDWFELQMELGLASQHAGDADGAVGGFQRGSEATAAGCGGIQQSGFGADAKRRRGGGDSTIQDCDAAASGGRHTSRESGASRTCSGPISMLQSRNCRPRIKLAPNNASLHYNLGLAYKLKDQLDKAVPEFQNCDPVAARSGRRALHARRSVLAKR